MKTLLNKYLFIIISLFFSFHLFSQNEKTIKFDSLTNVYQQTKQDSVKIKALISLGDLYDFSKLDSALIYYQKALSLSKKNGYKKLTALSLYYMGVAYQEKSEYKKAMDNFISSVKLYEDIGNKKGMAFSYNNMGIVNIINGNKDKAKEYFFKSLKLSEDIKNNKGIANAYANIGVFFEEQGNYEKAKEYYAKALDIYLEIKDIRRVGYLYNNLGIVSKNQGFYEQSIKYHKKALGIDKKMGNESHIATNYTNLSALNIMIADSSDISVKQKKEYLQKAVKYANLSYEFAKKGNLKLDEHDATLLLRRAYKKLGNYKEALKYTDIYIAKKDSIFNIKKAKALTEMELKYEAEKHKLIIENLENEKINDRNKLGFMFIVLLFLLIIGILLFFQNRKLKKAYSKIVVENIKTIEYKNRLDKLQKNKIKKTFPKGDVKYSKSGLSEERKEDIYNAIINAMELDKVFLKQNFKLSDLSEYLEINQMYISQVLNQKCNISFSNLINKYRVEEAKKLFLDSKYNNYSIDGISQNAGFNSVKTFNRVFKNMSGVTPSYFREFVPSLKNV